MMLEIPLAAGDSVLVINMSQGPFDVCAAIGKIGLGTNAEGESNIGRMC
jgi:hypothetical protein